MAKLLRDLAVAVEMLFLSTAKGGHLVIPFNSRIGLGLGNGNDTEWEGELATNSYCLTDTEKLLARFRSS